MELVGIGRPGRHCSSALPVVGAAAAVSIGSHEPRDIRVVVAAIVPGHAFVAEEKARRTVHLTMTAGVALSAAVVFAVAALFKEILYYAMDPQMARVSGVRVGLIHYLLMLMVAMTLVWCFLGTNWSM